MNKIRFKKIGQTEEKIFVDDNFYLGKVKKQAKELGVKTTDISEKKQSDPFKDTDEFDMRGVLKSWGP